MTDRHTYVIYLHKAILQYHVSQKSVYLNPFHTSIVQRPVSADLCAFSPFPLNGQVMYERWGVKKVLGNWFNVIWIAVMLNRVVFPECYVCRNLKHEVLVYSWACSDFCFSFAVVNNAFWIQNAGYKWFVCGNNLIVYLLAWLIWICIIINREE